MSAERKATPGEVVPPAAAARAAFARWLDDAGSDGRTFLQLHLRADRMGLYAVRHLADRDLAAVALRQITDPFAARQIAQTREDGEHRPLKTAPDLQRGWRFEALDEDGLWTVLDYLYPACVAHWYSQRTSTLRVTHWDAVAGRQSGMYAPVRLLDEGAVRRVARACCADEVCLRQVSWGLDATDPTPLLTDTDATGDGVTPAQAADTGVPARVPCPEACSVFVSFARAVLKVEREPRTDLPGLGSLAESEVAQIRSLVSAAAAGPLELPREGEFDLALNRRRLRYLALRLEEGRPAGSPQG